MPTPDAAMPAPDQGAASGKPPPPRVAELLDQLADAAWAGYGLGAVPAGITGRFGLDALTVNATVPGDLVELVWCDPSDGLGPELEDLQFALGDGPTVQAARQGTALTESDLAATDPTYWPAFLAAVALTPARAVIAVPLQVGDATIGALTGYRTTLGAPTAVQQYGLRRMAPSLALMMLNSTTPTSGRETEPGLALVLYRAEIHQATGFLSEALGIPLGEALLRLRAHATTREEPLIGVARSLLARRLPAGALDT